MADPIAIDVVISPRIWTVDVGVVLGPAGPPGDPGPAGPAGPIGRAVSAQVTAHLVLAGSSVSAMLLPTVRNPLMLKLQSITNVMGNYTIQLLNGNGGAIIYEATGVNSTTYNDVATAYLENTVDIWVKLIKIDPVALEADVLLRYLDLEPAP